MLEKLNPTDRDGRIFDDLPVSIVIPLYNEQAIITENLEALGFFFDRLLGAGNWLFILVDNGSTDATPRLVAAALDRWPLSQAIHLADPNYGAALKAGLRSASTKWVYLLDIEQWDLPFITWAWNNRNCYDIFVASKRLDPTLNHQQPYRRVLSTGLNGVLQLFFGFSGTDTHGPKLLNWFAMEAIVNKCELGQGQFDTEFVLRAMRNRKRIVEVPIEYRESRPHRNWMIKKIVGNLLALQRLQRVMRNIPFEGSVRYYRVTREDVLAARQTPVADAREEHASFKAPQP
jgi:glycosyltransferase involved in cell wall biosynthesis